MSLAMTLIDWTSPHKYPLYIHAVYSHYRYLGSYSSTHKLPSKVVKNYLTHKLNIKDIVSVYSDVYINPSQYTMYDSTTWI